MVHIFAVIGGDLRQIHLANALAEEGKTVLAAYLDREDLFDRRVQLVEDIAQAAEKATVYIFPLPVTVDGSWLNTPLSKKKVTLKECMQSLPKGSLFLGGMVDTEAKEEARKRGIFIHDYLLREELAILNAVPTAEGALQIAMEETAATLYGSRCLITGYGRIGKVLARDLQALGADVTVAARKYSDLAWLQVEGFKSVPIEEMGGVLQRMDLVFNTVPAIIFPEELLKKLPPHCLVIDLASKPGGLDFEKASSLGIHTIWALSLPGKVAPITAGKMIKESILHILEERGEA